MFKYPDEHSFSSSDSDQFATPVVKAPDFPKALNLVTRYRIVD
jgi:hypothetical protein